MWTETFILGFGRGNLKESDHLEVLDVDYKIILKLIFKKYNVDQDSSVGIATRYGLDGPGIESR